MRSLMRSMAELLARVSVERPWRVLTAVGLVTVAALVGAGGLEMKTNVVDMLPTHSPAVQSYLEVTEEFGESSALVVLEGERDRMVEAARELIPRLEAMDLLYNVQGTVPLDYFLDHGLMLIEEKDLDRTLERFEDPSLIGFLRGLNDDFEREYTDSEENLREDEVEIAQSMHGLERSLEILAARLDGRDYASVEEAVDVMLVGEPWMFSLDRRMMLIPCMPTFSMMEIDPLLETTEQMQAILADMRTRFPDVSFGLTGNYPLQKDEMDAMTRGSIILFFVALVLIYLLLTRSFGGWRLPFIALIPLVTGIIWTGGLLRLVYGSLNMFTAMFAIILVGLGIDFAIHLISRYYEERAGGQSSHQAIVYMLEGTGVAVLAGGLTTAAAFLALLIGETKGVSELGFTIGAGIALTLLVMFVSLPALLVVRDRQREKKGRSLSTAGAREGWPAIGRVAAESWRHWGLFLALFALVSGLSLWAGLRNQFEMDWLELEPKGLENVRLQREIPERFGMTTEGAWVIVDSIEEAREIKERTKDLSMVSEVSAISDLLPTAARSALYQEPLTRFRARMERRRLPVWRPGTSDEELAAEIERLWDNLDLMSNLAFTAGLDRVVRSLDRITGYDNATDTTDDSAVLPSLTRRLEEGIDSGVGQAVHRAWFERMRSDLVRMADTAPVGVEDLPGVVRRAMLPRDGSERFLVNISARDYLWHQDTLRRFSEQMGQVDPRITGTPQMTLEFLALTGRDGRNGLILAFVIIILLLLVTFRGPVGLIAIIPLVGGTLMMLGVMALLGMKYNFMNFMALPVILGIGIDDGVHAIHRFREVDRHGQERVFDAFRFVGRAILLTTLTTMIGFGSLGFQAHVAMASFGIVLMIGVGACFVCTILFLPAVLRLLVGQNLRSAPVRTTATLSTALLLALGTSLVSPAVSRAQETGAAWMERIENAEQVDHSYAVMRQTITTTTGAERTFTLRAWSAQEGDMALMAYTEPARVDGDRILQLNGGDDIWYYMKRRDTTRHFAGHTRKQSAMGSDFSYEDMASGDFSEDYTAEILGYEDYQGVRCVKLKCIPTPSGPSYAYIIVWADTEHALSRKIEYYDEEGHLKSLFLTDFREIEGRTVAMKMEMVNHREGSRTVMETVEMTFAREPDSSLFTQAALSRALPPR